MTQTPQIFTPASLPALLSRLESSESIRLLAIEKAQMQQCNDPNWALKEDLSNIKVDFGIITSFALSGNPFSVQEEVVRLDKTGSENGFSSVEISYDEIIAACPSDLFTDLLVEDTDIEDQE